MTTEPTKPNTFKPNASTPTQFDIVAQSSESTVVAEYTRPAKRSHEYQSEADLEREFIHQLVELGYEYAPIRNEQDLVENLRHQLEKLNHYQFSDTEWNQFYKNTLANQNNGIIEKTRLIQEDHIQVLQLDNGTHKNLQLIDKTNIHNNHLQVINQYTTTETEGANQTNRYDVTILVNGLPLVHIELKRRGIPIKEAFNQINRYQQDSFWSASGLYEYTQIFVITNGTNTKYYSNTTRDNHIKETKNNPKPKKNKTSHSFEFTSYWADAKNTTLPDLEDFTNTFFTKHTLLNILTRYCVFTSENLLLVMRPYQIVATERILNRIEIANNYKKYGTKDGGGYIWHTTGSGKTLTSFKTAQHASKLNYINKVLFIVDRKDLDYQTMKEYDRFEKGAANSNTSTTILKRQLEDPNTKIIITTIQKLANFIKQNPKHPIYTQQIVLIFDECHRSQFGEMHLAITKNFRKYHLFGFTGTPIFATNATTPKIGNIATTEQAFGQQLHSYTIVDAIKDHNVLPFRIDYLKSMDKEEDIDDKEVWDIDREKAYLAPERIRLVTEYILTHFDQKTYRNNKTYELNTLTNIDKIATSKQRNNIEEIKTTQRINGFNSIFATASVEAAKAYYTEFKRQMNENPHLKLKIGLIYSHGTNENNPIDGTLDEENPENTTDLDANSREFLNSAINDYNQMFQTKYSTDGESFQNYYKDVSLRMKNKELDLLIVVNMFLTGFDATTLNTLWVDKNLRAHGLLQAYSRTNRILNSIKTYGNIVCFRNLEKRTKDALALFGDKNAAGIVLLRGYKDYYEGYKDENGKHHTGYKEMVEKLIDEFSLDSGIPIREEDQKEFISLFGAILRMKNLLRSFDEFAGNEILQERQLQDYLSWYQDLRDEWIKQRIGKEKENINDDIIFEIELIKQVDINIDYILELVEKYHDSHCEDHELRISIQKAVDSSPSLRPKKILIENFIDGLNDVEDILLSWREHVAQEKEHQLAAIVSEENLNETEAKKFVEKCLQEGEVKTTGTDIVKVLPKMSRFSRDGKRAETKSRVIDKLKVFVERFSDII